MPLTRLLFRRGIFSQLNSASPAAQQGEPIWTTDTQELRVADGTTAPASLPPYAPVWRGSVLLGGSATSVVVSYTAFNKVGRPIPWGTIALPTAGAHIVSVKSVYINPSLPQITFYFSDDQGQGIPGDGYYLTWAVFPPIGS